FSFEGTRRAKLAVHGVSQLRPYVDNLIVIHNDRLLSYVNQDAGMLDAFRTADDVVTQGILSVSELINVPGEINVDFADVRSIMRYPGGALMGIGIGRGKMGAVDAVKQAMSNPLLNISIKGAEGVLFSVKGGKSLTLGAVNAAGELVGRAVRKDASIYFGMSIDDSLDDGVKLTLIATGLKHDNTGLSFGGRLRNLIPGF
ncbi:MAG: cell division protein FtsZ, partial [Anaerolineales bacterium]|nr:cell division protein FtsZ [Anaerolineales bacterium]